MHVQEDVLAPVHFHASPIKVSLFLLAVSKGDLALSLRFLELGADVHQVIELGDQWKNWFKSEVTALQLAAAIGCYQLVEELVSRGAILAGVGITVPDTDEGQQIVQFLQSRGSNQCTRFTPESNTQDATNVLKSKAAMNRLMGPAYLTLAYGFDVTIKNHELGDKRLGNIWPGDIVYDAEQDGWDSSDFHRKCDSQGYLLFIMRTLNDAVIGAFCKAHWRSERGFITDTNAFLFEINADGDMMKCDIHTNEGYTLYAHPNFGPVFGGSGNANGTCQPGQHDLMIPSNPNENSCSANVGITFMKNPSAGLLSVGASFKLKSFIAVRTQFV